jgi:single-strand DNA-binding protein
MLNRVEIIGRLGQDPDLRYTGEGRPIAQINMATSASFRDRESGIRKEHTEWHKVVLFGKSAEVAERFLKKGSLCHIEGVLKTRKWTSKDGMEHKTTEIVGNHLLLLDPKPETSKSEPDTSKEEDSSDLYALMEETDIPF